MGASSSGPPGLQLAEGAKGGYRPVPSDDENVRPPPETTRSERIRSARVEHAMMPTWTADRRQSMVVSPSWAGERRSSLVSPVPAAAPDSRASPVLNPGKRGGLVDMGDAGEASPWRFVEAGWFQCMGALVIMFNLATMVIETQHPTSKQEFFWPDQGLLVFYLFELTARACYFRGNFFCGPMRLVAWNLLDVLVVVAGVVDQWVFSVMTASRGGAIQAILKFLRVLRLVRVLKIVRILLESDLSWTEEPKFQSFIGSVIGFNALLMGMETDIKWQGWFYIEQVLLTIYVFELAVLLKRFGSGFFSCSHPDIGWNLLDFTIVMSSVMDSWLIPGIALVGALFDDDDDSKKKAKGPNFGQVMMLMRMMRLMRILRLVKLVKAVKPLFILVTGVLAALQGVVWVLILTLVTLYAMGIMSARLIGQKMLFPPGSEVDEDVLEPFLTVPDSMFTLFRIMSGASSDEEASAIDRLMKQLPTVKFAFVFFMITSSWTLLSILTAVVSENMITTTGQQEEEMKLAQFEEDRAEHLRSLQELFACMDVSGDGLIDHKELSEFLQDERNAQKTSRLCRVPHRDVMEVLSAIKVEKEKPVDMKVFVERLVDVATPVTQKSIMVLESKIEKMTRAQERIMLALQGVVMKGVPLIETGIFSPPTSPVAPGIRQPDQEPSLIQLVADGIQEVLSKQEELNHNMESALERLETLEAREPPCMVAAVPAVFEHPRAAPSTPQEPRSARDRERPPEEGAPDRPSSARPPAPSRCGAGPDPRQAAPGWLYQGAPRARVSLRATLEAYAETLRLAAAPPRARALSV